MEQSSDALEFLTIKRAIRKQRLIRKRNWVMLISFLAVAVSIMAYLLVLTFPTVDGRVREPIKFEVVPLREVVAVLERKFDVQIETMEGLDGCKFSGSFYNDSPEQVISVIAESLGARFTMTEDGTFRIEGGECR